MKKSKKVLLSVVLCLGFIILALLVVFVLVPSVESNRPRKGSVNTSSSASWMSAIDDSMPLNRINIPGCHDAGTKNVQLAFFSKCQGSDIYSQLMAGYRYLDIRLGDPVETESGLKDLHLMHGFTYCRQKWLPWSKKLTLSYVLEQCYEFLEQNPTETILFVVKQEHGSESVAEFQRILNAHIQQNEAMWWLNEWIPSMGQSRGKIVLCRRYEDRAGLGDSAGVPVIWKNQDGHDDVLLSYDRSAGYGNTVYVQDRYEYAAKDKWNAFVTALTEVPAFAENQAIFINFLSTKGTAAYGHPYKYASNLNKKLISYPMPEFSGWTIVDFGSPALAAWVYSSNF